MVRRILSAPEFLAVIALVLMCLWRRLLTKQIRATQQQGNNIFEVRRRILARVRMGTFDKGSNRVDVTEKEDRAEAYLRRIVALTGATQMSNCCVLDVGKTRFNVYVAYVVRLGDLTDPTCTQEHTCFYVANQEMPAAERIATVLLHLKNNPELFDGWVKRNALKADGQVFKFRLADWFG